MTRQEIFNRAYKHALSMKALAKDVVFGGGQHPTYSSKYRAKNGEKCLMGSFIPDEKYDPSIEGKAVDILFFDMEGLGLNDLSENISGFLLDLQRCHDRASSIDGMHGMMERLKHFAGDRGLTIPE
jgi:hypothetical protein